MGTTDLFLLRRLWVAASNSGGLADFYEFRAEHGDSMDEIDRLERLRYLSREPDKYRLTVLGLQAGGDPELQQALSVGEPIYTRLLAQFRNSQTRAEPILLKDLSAELSIPVAQLVVYLHQLSDAIGLWCSQYMPTFAGPDAYLKAGEGVYRYKGIAGVQAQMELWQADLIAVQQRLSTVQHEGLLTEAPPAVTATASAGLETPEQITVPWLLAHVPISFWIAAAGLLVSAFAGGIRVGQISAVKQLFGFTESPAGAATRTADCSGLSSTDEARQASVDFRNLSSNRTVWVYWINYDGAPKYQFSLGPNGTYHVDTFVSHSYCIRDKNTSKEVLAVTVTSADQDVVIPP